ncbi:vitamin K epoxide reductase family protein [Vulcanisaeta distributa]|uniref:Vitamin K epoxide reductase n=1 Tax=Vulcanisaeta distributa (strain DSM 14429 / JCM 11212 / NBRC 100878 / IC-017) TaxID=572478 RepID=E1QTN8_VULDI|nr:vitamin K epoxide reductase family protein [Vulcanisaeta distributa]ADN49753.1 Vitamin K epoxide reductase [Vulcanisaeta distributa DSM 14429]
MRRLTGTWLVLMLIFSAVGLFASSIVIYTYYYLRELPPLCTSFKSPFPGITIDCERVLSSKYSDIGGVPLDLLAAIWFIVNIILVLMYDLGPGNLATLAINALFYWRFIGIVVVPYLIFVETYLLHALCIYCTVMHIMIIIDFAVITIFFIRVGKSPMRGLTD